MVYLNTHIDELDLEVALAEVSLQRREAALRYVREQDRRQSLAAYLLLMQAMEQEYGIKDAPEFEFGPHGKPWMPAYPHIHFNLSHCPGAALCVVGDTAVGCDVESVAPSLDEDMCRRVCCEEEIAAVLSDPHPALAFTRLWTRKEAYLKYTGEGLYDGLGQLLLSPGVKAVSFQSVVAPDSSWVYTVCRPTRTRKCL